MAKWGLGWQSFSDTRARLGPPLPLPLPSNYGMYNARTIRL